MSKHAPRGPVKVHEPVQTEHPLQKALLAPGAQRCSAKSKRSQKPCNNPAIAGGFVCRMHGGSAPQVKMAARERLMNLQPLAIQTLHNLLHREEFPTVQLGAAKDVLDRTEGKAAESLAITGADGGPLIVKWQD
jgi:hypothetical protein